jgi:hypothetical protein
MSNASFRHLQNPECRWEGKQATCHCAMAVALLSPRFRSSTAQHPMDTGLISPKTPEMM